MSGHSGFIFALIGRFIFGFGGDTLSVCQAVIITRWFSKKHLAFAFGLNATVTCLGSVLNASIEPELANYMGAGFALTVGLGVCLLSFFAGIGLIVLEDIAIKSDIKNKIVIGDSKETVNLRDISKFDSLYWLITVNSLFFYAGINLFYNISNRFLRTSYNYTNVEAGRINSATYFVSAFTIPLLGVVFD